jgi:murein DD-endopeptidase MepM/ murein hydrolase activator NlpD
LDQPQPTQRWRRAARPRLALLLAASALAATATIASIPGHDGRAHSSDSAAAPPLQTFAGEATAVGVPNATQTTAVGTAAPPADAAADWTEITVRRGDTFSSLLASAGFEAGELSGSALNRREARPLYQLKPHHKLRVRANDEGRILELTYAIDHADTLRLRRVGDGFEITRESLNFETRFAHLAGTIQTNLFEDGQEAGLSDPLIHRLVEIFGWDIDFARDLRPGDHFSVIHEEKYWLGQKIADGQILAAEFVNRGISHRVVAHHDSEGSTAYYKPDGTSVRRQFLRTPIEFSRVSSRYTDRATRFHPILKTWTAHRGVDYAAPKGTPVRATAIGRVLALGVEGGYGKRIVIRHNGSYSTLYAHLDRYAANLRAGSYVQQGQIIGYVGSTGLSTGPHLHYELQVDGAHYDPLRFKFPAGQPIPAAQHEAFLTSAAPLFAQLERMGDSVRLAAARH